MNVISTAKSIANSAGIPITNRLVSNLANIWVIRLATIYDCTNTFLAFLKSRPKSGVYN
jgi:hypothetical protein